MENNQKMEDYDGHNICISDIPLPPNEAVQTNGITAAAKGDVKDNVEQETYEEPGYPKSNEDAGQVFANLNHTVSEEFKNQVFECIQEVRISSMCESSESEYMDGQIVKTGNQLLTEVELKQGEDEALHTSDQLEETEIHLAIGSDNDSSNSQNLDEESFENRKKDLELAKRATEDVQNVNEQAATEVDASSTCESSSLVAAEPVLGSRNPEEENNAESKSGEQANDENSVTVKTVVQSNGNETMSVSTTEQSITAQSEKLDSFGEDAPNSSPEKMVSEKTKNVIQCIYDDWQDEPLEEGVEAPVPKDSVEQELKNLLQPVEEDSYLFIDSEMEQQFTGQVKFTRPKKILPSKTIAVEKNLSTPQPSPGESTKNKSCAEIVASIKRQDAEKSMGKPAELERNTKAGNIKGRVMVPPVSKQVIVKKEEEIVKERLKAKQKNIEQPPGGGADLIFIKKLSQRLSHKLGAASATSVAPSETSAATSTTSAVVNKPESNSSQDHMELLAILQGDDVEPDWSADLKPQEQAENKQEERSPKLRPSVEREIALKQLLELPGSHSPKKQQSVKTPVEKEPKKKVYKKAEDKKVKKEGKKGKPTVEGAKSQSRDSTPVKMDTKEDGGDENAGRRNSGEELRSGRKRKPTEKAREHEQSFTQKRQKMKNRASMNKIETAAVAKANDAGAVDVGKPAGKEDQSKVAKDKIQVATTKQQQKKKTATTPPLPKKTGKTKNAAAAVKEVKEKEMPKPKTRGRAGKISEVEKLLQDEGVVNLLYDVEQTDKKRRLVPITKSQTMVMDVEKAAREWHKRKKMVRNAVLQQSTEQVQARSKRLSAVNCSPSSAGSSVVEGHSELVKSKGDGILTTKIANTSEDSVIIRRHSTSSYSSAPGSPRIFMHDGGGAMEGGFSGGEGVAPSLNSNFQLARDEYTTSSSTTSASSSPKRAVAGTKRLANKDDKQPAAVILAKRKRAAVLASSLNNSPVKKLDHEGEGDDIKKGKKIAASSAGSPGKKVEKNAVSASAAGLPVASSPPKRGRKVGSGAAGKGSKAQNKNSASPVGKAKKGEGSDGEDADTEEEEEKEEKGRDELSSVLAEAATALASSVPSSQSMAAPVRMTRKARVKRSLEPEFKTLKSDSADSFSYKDISIQRHEKIVKIILTPSISSTSKLKNALTVQMMKELIDVLSKLRNDPNCHVVLFTSTGTSFCEGIEIGSLLHEDTNERKKRAEEMAETVREFINILARFNKPIVAAVQGSAVGLGVTMLPLFDVVFASEKATFSTPCGQLAHVAEGVSVLSSTHNLNMLFVNEMIFAGRTMTASEALTAGLVTRVLLPDRFQAELLRSITAMSNHSLESMRTTKFLLRQHSNQTLSDHFEREFILLAQHWCTDESQQAMKAWLLDNEKIEE